MTAAPRSDQNGGAGFLAMAAGTAEPPEKRQELKQAPGTLIPERYPGAAESISPAPSENIGNKIPETLKTSAARRYNPGKKPVLIPADQNARERVKIPPARKCSAERPKTAQKAGE